MRRKIMREDRGTKRETGRPSDSVVTCNGSDAMSPFVTASHSSWPYTVRTLRWEAGGLPWEPGLRGRRGRFLGVCVMYVRLSCDNGDFEQMAGSVLSHDVASCNVSGSMLQTCQLLDKKRGKENDDV